VREYAADVVEDKRIVAVLEYGAMLASEDVHQVRVVILTDSAHVGIQPGSPRSVTETPHELDKLLAVGTFVTTASTLTPLRPPHNLEISCNFRPVDGRLGNEKDFRLNLSHAVFHSFVKH
jgi:hypothetical protein